MNHIVGDSVAEPDPKIIEWVQATKAGSQEAFAELVYSFQDMVFNLCYRMLNDGPEAEDATQEAFLRAHRYLERYDESRSFKTWLLSIASNHCIDRLRKRRMHYVSIDDPINSESSLALSSDEPTPEHAMVDNERGQFIQLMLNELAADYRAAVILRYWYDYSYAEIAQTMQTTESAIKSRLFRARQQLADLLRQNEESNDDTLNSRLTQ